MYTKQDLANIRDIFLSNLDQINSLILFGSYSKKTADGNSDIDIAALLEKKLNRDEKLSVLNKIWNELARNGYEVDIVIKTIEEFNEEKEIPSTISYTFSKEGTVLWQKTN